MTRLRTTCRSDVTSRRGFFRSAGALALLSAYPAMLKAAVDLPIADSHSHIGVLTQRFANGTSLKTQMEESGVTLLAWTFPSDARWTRRTDLGIDQIGVPAAGDQANYVRTRLDTMRSRLRNFGLDYVRTPADVDAARAGKAQVVLALEGAGFTEDGLDLLDKFHAEGLRHLQLVHFIRNGLGDFQTERPEHNGLTELGVKVIQACNRLGILVDLAHATQPVVDKALEVSTAPMIWSHSGITAAQYDWRRSTNQARMLYIDYAKKIAQRGGAVGLWSMKSMVGDVAGYASELMRMADAIGPEHVMFGTDMDGVGRFGMMDDLGDLRKVANVLRERGVGEQALRAICFDNYARCLKAAMAGRQG